MVLYSQRITFLAYGPGFGGTRTFLLYVNIVARLVDLRERTSDFLFSDNVIDGFCLVCLVPLIHGLLGDFWHCGCVPMSFFFVVRKWNVAGGWDYLTLNFLGPDSGI
jgi:hypothetical protein